VTLAVRPRSILLAGWVFVLVYAYPGQMTIDTYDHLSEARAGVYTDSHPPLLNWIWKLTEYLIAAPFGVLLLQTATFLGGLYLLMRRVFPPRRAAWLATAVFVFPPVMLPMTAVWKDSLMAGFLVLGFALILEDRRRWKLLGLGAILLGTGTRYNAFAAAAPLVVFAFEVTPLPWLKRYALAVVAWFAVTAAAFTANSALTDRQMHYWHSSLAVFDIVGTLAHVDAELPDARLEQLFAGTELQVHASIHGRIRALYNPRDFMPIVTSDTQLMWNMPVYGQESGPEPQRDAIERAWREVVTTYPAEYLAYRAEVMAEVLSLTRARPAGVVPKREQKYKEFGLSQRVPMGFSRLQRHMSNVMSSIWYGVPIFSPWMYVVLAVILLPLSRGSRDAFALLASGLLVEASLYFLAPSPDYRYSHWLVVCVWIALILIVTRRSRRVAARAGDDPALAGVAGERPEDAGAPRRELAAGA
jgi:hypothetical protein